jgi:hypothetical protein
MTIDEARAIFASLYPEAMAAGVTGTALHALYVRGGSMPDRARRQIGAIQWAESYRVLSSQPKEEAKEEKRKCNQLSLY